MSDRDFSYRSLIGNAVLRWEWRPGSTLFLVWQQSRINSLYGDGINGIDPWIGSFDVGRDMSDMFATPANNIFAIKMSYWLNPKRIKGAHNVWELVLSWACWITPSVAGGISEGRPPRRGGHPMDRIDRPR